MVLDEGHVCPSVRWLGTPQPRPPQFGIRPVTTVQLSRKPSERPEINDTDGTEGADWE